MKLLQNILATVDLTESSDKVIDQAIVLAKKFNSQLSLLHVIPDESVSDEFRNYVEKSVQTSLANMADKIRSEGVRVKDIIIETGVPFEKIIHKGQEKGYNLIMAGSGNKNESDSFRLGTTVEKLMRKNQIPLWVVKTDASNEIKRIVCPVDFSDASARALRNAITLAEKFEAELNIITVFSPVKVYSSRFEVDNEGENLRLKRDYEFEFTAFLEKFDLGSLQPTVQMIKGEPYREILKYIRDNEIDLLVMGTTGKTILSRLLMGSVTEKVTRELPCNFITTKAQDITNYYFESNLSSIESILNAAKQEYAEGNFKQALEKYTIALKQYPANIPMIMGIIATYEALNQHEQANYYKVYGEQVVKRIWGDEYLASFKF